MISRMDNLKEGASKRLLQNFAPAFFTALALVGAIGLPLKRLESTRIAHTQALVLTDHAREIRSELREFRSAGGEELITVMSDLSSEILPRELSRISIHAALQLIAHATSFEVEALTVGEFVPAPFKTLDDSIGMSEVSLSGSGTLSCLDKIISSMRSLGYPISVRSFQLKRLSPDDAKFEVRAILDLFQAIPPQAISEINDLPMEEE
ncbi:MAG: hypothetical protein ACI8X5_001870 [Planctomycetota bacterium]|jgi:hypothetical protein